MKARVQYTEALHGRLNPPSSKNYTTRYLLVAALADGDSIVHHPAQSQDADVLQRCLVDLGAEIREEADDNGGRRLRVRGFGANPAHPGVLNVGNAGAVARLLMGVGALLPNIRFETPFPASLGQRPHDELFAGLQQLGARVESADGRLPATIRGGRLHGGTVRISGSRSSQFLSSLLFLAPLVGQDIHIEVIDELLSRPLVHTTLEVMREAGIVVDAAEDLMSFGIAGGQSYSPREYSVNGDWPSSAGVLAAGALTNSGIIVERLRDDCQGERAVLGLLRDMGVDVSWDGQCVELRGHRGLRGMDFDGDQATDAVLAMLPLAAHAEGTSRFYGIGNLRYKECDRITVPVAELRRFGVDCHEEQDAIIVRGRPEGYEGGHEAATHDDHRVAQMQALMGLRSRRGVVVRDAETVGKSYPAFFSDLVDLGAVIDMDEG
ncbi:MAG: 3-phosphoshikimate 1-carboxyvinyltransferase [bacterium]|nr:3-phosphoshikimate 1-carboxyvinyltransferase [bacterium]